MSPFSALPAVPVPGQAETVHWYAEALADYDLCRSLAGRHAARLMRIRLTSLEEVARVTP